MKNFDKQSVSAVLAALTLIVTGTLYPPAPRGAWWNAAFQIVCDEAAEPRGTEGGGLEFRWAIADLWKSLWG